MFRNIFLLLIFLNSTPATAQLGWYVVPNAPTSPRFEDASFIGNTGWIVKNPGFAGSAAIVYKTTDAGDTWFAVDSIGDFNSYIRSVEFINDSIGIIGQLPSGPNNYGIYRTTDGGQSFAHITAVPFVNDVGVCGLAHYGNTVIGVGIYDGQRNFFKSLDAGATWTVTQLDSNLVNGLVDCHMFNDSIYILTGQGIDSVSRPAIILKTYDGGNSWQKVAQATAPYSWGWKLHFRGGSGSCSIETAEHIFMTSDSGSTWTEKYVGTCNSAPSQEYGGCGFINDTLGWVADQFNTPCFKETKDGGATWTSYQFGNSVDRMVRIDSVTMLAFGITVYKYSFDSVLTSITEIPREKPVTLKVWPNPADEGIYMRIKLQYKTSVRMRLMNAEFKTVMELPAEFLDTGEYVRRFFRTGDLPSGVYYVVVMTNYNHFVEKTIIKH